ncbi:MAG: hypothetical protein EA398_02875 [Deltaproteobacteria bacterium]|nr:MAG: hypothetical protein EA398_02875 [Deltaproteobacteria bacterium]
MTPGTVLRGSERVVRVSGDGVGDGALTVETAGVAIRRQTRLGSDARELIITASDLAPLGDVSFALDGVVLETGDALRVLPGPVGVFGVEPVLVPRGETTRVVVRGRNLDTVTRAEIGAPLEVTVMEVVDPVRLALDIRVPQAVSAGPRTLVLFRGTQQAALVDAVEVPPAVPVVETVSPSEVLRGEPAVVTVTGSGFLDLEGLSAGPRVDVSGLEVIDDGELTVRLRPRDDAARGPAPLVLFSGGSSTVFGEAWTIVAGEVSLLAVRPSRVYRAEEPELVFEGRHLDDVDRFELGEGVEVTGVRSATAARIAVSVRVAEDAPMTLRDVEVSGVAGTARLAAALTVGDVRLPVPALAYPREVEMPATDTGALRFVELTFTNEGEIAEVVTIGNPTGDSDILAFGDPDDPFRIFDELTFELPPGESVTRHIRYAPVIRTTSVAAWEVLLRDGEEVETLVLRGQSGAQRLRFSRVSPLQPGPVPLLGSLNLPTLQLIQDGQDAAVFVERLDVEVVRNDIALSDPGQVLTWSFESGTGADPPPWAGSRVVWSVFGDRLGLYEVRLLFATALERAPLVPFVVRFRVAEEPSDPGPVVPPSTEPGATEPPTDPVEPSTGPPTDGSDEVPDGSGSGGGCCAVGGAPPSPLLPVLVLLGLFALRRRW